MKGFYPESRALLAIFWKDDEKPCNTSNRIIGDPAEIRTHHLPLRVLPLRQPAKCQHPTVILYTPTLKTKCLPLLTSVKLEAAFEVLIAVAVIVTPYSLVY